VYKGIPYGFKIKTIVDIGIIDNCQYVIEMKGIMEGIGVKEKPRKIKKYKANRG